MIKSRVCPKCGGEMKRYSSTMKGALAYNYTKCQKCGARFKFITERRVLSCEEVKSKIFQTKSIHGIKSTPAK